MRHRAYTLAEVLVTLAIIGVLAAIISPVLVGLQPNKEMVLYKKAFYLASRTVNELINDDDFYPEVTNTEGFADTNTIAGYHGRTYGGNGTDFPGDQKFCGLFASRLNIRGNVDCTQRISLADGGNFTTTDGIVWSIPVSDFENEEDIYVDIDGARGRNCADGDNVANSDGCAEGQNIDRFGMTLNATGHMTAKGNIARAYLAETNNTTKLGKVKEKITKGTYGCLENN